MNQEQINDNLRTAFFKANPTATDSDWQRLAQSIIDEHLRQRTFAQPVNRYERIRQEMRAKQQPQAESLEARLGMNK